MFCAGISVDCVSISTFGDIVFVLDEILCQLFDLHDAANSVRLCMCF